VIYIYVQGGTWAAGTGTDESIVQYMLLRNHTYKDLHLWDGDGPVSSSQCSCTHCSLLQVPMHGTLGILPMDLR
jgi:hypothetical protein